MTNTFPKTPQDFFALSQEYFKMIPTSEKDIKDAFQKVQTVVATENSKFTKATDTYKRASTGDATANEIAEANKLSQEVAVAARFGAYISMPGAIFTVPAMAKLAAQHNVEFIPKSVSEAFGI